MSEGETIRKTSSRLFVRFRGVFFIMPSERPAHNNSYNMALRAFLLQASSALKRYRYFVNSISSARR